MGYRAYAIGTAAGWATALGTNSRGKPAITARQSALMRTPMAPIPSPSAAIAGTAPAHAANVDYFASNGIAIGNEAQVGSSGSDAVALGFGSNANGASALAFGDSAQASNNGTSAFGGLSRASGLNGTAIGYNSNASGTDSTAIGISSTASGPSNGYATAIGGHSAASGDYSTALGSYTSANAANSVAIGGNSASGAGNAAYVDFGSRQRHCHRQPGAGRIERQQRCGARLRRQRERRQCACLRRQRRGERQQRDSDRRQRGFGGGFGRDGRERHRQWRDRRLDLRHQRECQCGVQ